MRVDASTRRNLLFLSPHFPPDSAAGTHRARILAPHLEKWGWHPIVLTVDPASVEGELDHELGASVPDNLELIRVPAWPHSVTRRAGFGDLGLRAYRALRRAAVDLARTRAIGATLVTTYPTYPAMIASALKRMKKVPFVLDLQDPWVGAWGNTVGPGGTVDLRSRASRRLAVTLEHRVASNADALMSVTATTIDELVARVPEAASRPQLEVPIGWEPRDWQRTREDGQPNALFTPDPNDVNICAVGTLLPTAIDGLRAFLCGLSQVLAHTTTRRRIRVWFVGTSNERRVHAPAQIGRFIDAANARETVYEHPPRLAYFDALRVLRDASAVLVLGSAEPHYTPSRVFPAIASRRPVIARLHRQSPAWHLLSQAGTSRPVRLIAATNNIEDEAREFRAALETIVNGAGCAPPVDDAPLMPFSGEALARQVSNLLDQVTAA